jgi:amidase
MTDLCFRTASDLARAIRGREISSTEVVESFLARVAAQNSALNAIITLDEATARQRARLADQAVARGNLWGPLHGVPVTFKDVFETAGLRTSAGHKPLAEHVPDRDATVVARLRSAGAIVLGKTNMPALAMDTQCENPLFGRTNNPWNAERTPGGSSGGEAAALAAGLTPLGLGSDFGGSVRIPAHYCGVYCLKPTEGRVPQSGHLPPLPGTMNWIRHFVVSGPLARSIEDLRLCLKIIAGPDGRDLAVSHAPLTESPARPLKDYSFAWTDDFGGLPISAETHTAMHKLADDLDKAGCIVEKAAPKNFSFEEVWRTYGELVGVLMATQAPAFSRPVLAALGRFLFRKDLITSSGTRRATANIKCYFDLLERRDQIVRSLEQFLSGYDAWLCPVSSTPAVSHRAAGQINTPIDVDGVMVPGHLGAIGYTCPFNLTGSPVVVMPLRISENGLPIGAQVVGRRWGEMDLLNISGALHQVVAPIPRPPNS